MADESTTTNTQVAPQPSGVDPAAYEKLAKDAAAMASKLERIEADKVAADAKAKADKAALEGKAAEALAEATARLADVQKKIEGYTKRDQEAADALYGKLPEAVQKRVALLKSKFPDPAEWLGYLQAEQAALPKDTGEGSEGEPAPIKRGLDGSTVKKTKGYKVLNKEYLEEKFGLDTEAMHIEEAEHLIKADGSSKMWFPLKKYLSKLNTIGGEKLTDENARNRGRSKVVK